jgi:hypothetical protein
MRFVSHWYTLDPKGINSYLEKPITTFLIDPYLVEIERVDKSNGY